MHRPGTVLFLLTLLSNGLLSQETLQTKPLRVAVVGLVHTHVHWILGRERKNDIEIVGIAEPNRELASRYAKQHGFDMGIVYPTMEEMIRATKPESVFAFNTIYDHLSVVQYCAPLGIHVMVEKPLAVSLAHAREMLNLARKHRIHLLTNYETTWYGSNEEAYRLIQEERQIGELRKILFYTGHPGPVEIGCNQEFLEWLTDPVLNGGGALTDFGCYGANLATWLFNGEEPETVTAITQQVKPHYYPKVEDEATIILKYKKAQVIIQASWNWPYNRKEMEVYGVTGSVFCRDGKRMIIRKEGGEEEPYQAKPLPEDRADPFAYFAGLVRGKITLAPYDLSGPGNNEIVMKILEAAKASAVSGKTIEWKSFFK